MKLSTIDYLHQNKNCLVLGMQYTINDLRFMKENGFDEIIINENKDTKEILTTEDVIERIEDLYKLVQVARVDSGIYNNHEAYMENLTYVLNKVMENHGVEIKLK